jgi:hypothetical protein
LVDWLEIPISYAELGQVLTILNFKNMACGRDRGKEDKFAHCRKGIPDDWKNYFDEDGGKVQKELFDFLKKLGVSEENRILVGYDTMIWQKGNK